MKKIDSKTILIIIFSIILSVICSLLITFNKFSIHDIKTINPYVTLICFLFIILFSSFFIFKKEKVLDNLFKNRYKYALLLFIIIVLGRFNGLSIGAWNYEIQPSYDYSSSTIFGKPRNIRSDEWLVNTPLMLIQKYNNYGINNELIRSIPTNVYVLSTASVKDFIEIARPLSLGMFINQDIGLSVWWYGRLFLLFFTSFELLRILTKDKKKVSLFGAILISGSSVVQWFFASYITEILLGGQLALICFDKLLKSKKIINKVGWSFLMTIGFLDYCLILYPAHQIPFGYIFLIVLIYIINDNLKEDKKIILSNIVYLIIPAFLVIITIGRFYLLSKDVIKTISNTVYPGTRFTNGGYFYEWQRLLQTPYTLFLPFKNSGDACTISSFLCLFPLPIIIAIKYLIKEIKNIKNNSRVLLVLMLLGLAVIYFMFCAFRMPDFFVKYTLLSKTTVNAICAPIGLICIYLMCILFNDCSFKTIFGKIFALLASIALSYISVYLSNKFMPDYLSFKIDIILFIVFAFINYLYLTSSTCIKSKIFIWLLSIIGVVNIIFVNPVNIGTDMIFKKPLAKEINNIVKVNPDANWISLGSFITPNYLIMNGAKTINSTNLYPNLELWYKIDKNKKYEDIYNRYAHIVINLTNEDTSFDLIQADLFVLNLNYEDIKKLGVNYIYSNYQIDTDKVDLKQLYQEDNSYIYYYEY